MEMKAPISQSMLYKSENLRSVICRMLVIAQVVLAIQLPFSVIPLIKATSDSNLMGRFVNSATVQLCSWLATSLIFLANVLLFAAIILPSDAPGPSPRPRVNLFQQWR